MQRLYLVYKGWDGDRKNFYSPYASSVYLSWTIASTIGLLVTAVLPIVSWFATYRFSLSSAICAGIFSLLVAFCGASYWEVMNSRADRVHRKADFLAALLPLVRIPTVFGALLPLVCIPTVFSLFIGLYKWKTDD